MNRREISLQIRRTLLIRTLNYILRGFVEFWRTLFWKTNKNYNALLNLKNSDKNNPCVIFGNGPSLNKMDLEDFKNITTICCNGFYKKLGEMSYMPSYYIVEDNRVFEFHGEEINRLQGTKKCFAYDLKKYNADGDTIFFNFLRSYSRPSWKSFPKFSKRFHKKVYWGHNVVYACIQFAYHLGCNPIYLAGVDLTFELPKRYKKKWNIFIVEEESEEHFVKNYNSGVKKVIFPAYNPEIQKTHMKKAFSYAYSFLKKENISLINATIGGELDCVPRGKVKLNQKGINN